MQSRSITSWGYINDNFEPTDRLAVVINHQQRHDLIQRLVTAGQLAGPRYQAWLRFQNACCGGDVYVSMNPLKPDAHSRTKADIALVRHLYLDLDHDGAKALAGILGDSRLPTPSYLLNTSPGRHQVVWQVSGFTPAYAEGVQRAMAAAHGADRAATDVTRVLRIPGLFNRKYAPPHQVTAERLSEAISFPSDFRIEPQAEPALPSRHSVGQMRSRHGPITQSERDWAETLHRLYQGESPASVQAWLAAKRQDKANPASYAALTVSKAVRELERRREAGHTVELC